MTNSHPPIRHHIGNQYPQSGRYIRQCQECREPFGTDDKRKPYCIKCDEIKRLRAQTAALPVLIEAAKPIVEILHKHEQHLVATQSKLGSDDEVFEITAGQARALRSALSQAIGGHSEEGGE